MISARSGQPFDATLDSAATELVGTLGVRVLDPPATVVARSTAGIAEAPAGSGIYNATLTAPSAPGSYLLVWDWDPDGQLAPETDDGVANYAVEELQVTAAAVDGPRPVAQPLIATLAAPPGVDELGARLEVPVTRAVVSRYRPAVRAGDTWTVVLDAPATPGDYLLVWRTPDAEPPAYETFTLPPTPGAGADAPAADDDLVPTSEQVARLVLSRTHEDGSGSLTGTWSEDTALTPEIVDALCRDAAGEVRDAVGTAIPVAYADEARRVAAYRVAGLIALSLDDPEVTGDSSTQRRYDAVYLTGVERLAGRPWQSAPRLR